MRRVLGQAAPALLGLVAACSSTPALFGRGDGIGDVMMPPDEYVRPFNGRVTVMNLPHKPGAAMLSLSHHSGDQCAIWLPKVGEPDITQALYECLAIIEVANCNGATDVNTPAVRARASAREQARYMRPCSGRSWGWAFNAVRATAAVDQTASAVTAAPASLF